VFSFYFSCVSLVKFLPQNYHEHECKNFHNILEQIVLTMYEVVFISVIPLGELKKIDGLA